VGFILTREPGKEASCDEWKLPEQQTSVYQFNTVGRSSQGSKDAARKQYAHRGVSCCNRYSSSD
jgi:hypothetical protein